MENATGTVPLLDGQPDRPGHYLVWIRGGGEDEWFYARVFRSGVELRARIVHPDPVLSVTVPLDWDELQYAVWAGPIVPPEVPR